MFRITPDINRTGWIVQVPSPYDPSRWTTVFEGDIFVCTRYANRH